MKLDIVANARSQHQPGFAGALCDGLKRHGIEARILGRVEEVTAPVAACWGWRNGQRLRATGRPVLVMERAYLGDRFHWTSLGWNGLNGRAIWPSVDDGGARFERHFGRLMKPWRDIRAAGLAVIMGQCATDAAVAHIRIADWYAAAAKALRARGFDVLFRPHPLSRDAAPALPRHTGALENSLAAASLVVTFNSNSGVDAVMAGCPAIACDTGSMALPIAASGLTAPLQTPDRSEWAARIAWCQWLPEELERGDWVEPVMAAMPSGPHPASGPAKPSSASAPARAAP